MREIELTLAQRIVNRANCRVNYTKELLPSNGVRGRYIVTSEELFKGKNPSMEPGLILKITDAVEKECPFFKDNYFYNSIGGWTNPETKEYCVGANLHYFNLGNAARAAKDAGQVAIFDKHSDKVIYLKDLNYDFTKDDEAV